jgi:predicted transcriptional regulator
MLKRVSIWLDPDTIKRIAAMAKEEDRPVGWMIRKLLQEAVKK